MASTPLAAAQVHLDHIGRSEQPLDQPCRSDQHAIRAEPDGKVAVLSCDETPLSELSAALRHALGHRAGRHWPTGASA
jgi:hypothetical protein